MSAAVKTASNPVVNLLSRSRSRNCSPSAWWSRSVRRFRACWVTQAPGRVSGDAGDVDSAGRQFQEERDVDPFEEHRVDGEEVAGQDGVGLGGEELFHVGPLRRGAGSTPA
jgi:hypothetical protein